MTALLITNLTLQTYLIKISCYFTFATKNTKYIYYPHQNVKKDPLQPQVRLLKIGGGVWGGGGVHFHIELSEVWCIKIKNLPPCFLEQHNTEGGLLCRWMALS